MAAPAELARKLAASTPSSAERYFAASLGDANETTADGIIPRETAAVNTLRNPTSISGSFLVTATENRTLAASEVSEVSSASALTLMPVPGTPPRGIACLYQMPGGVI